MRRIQWFLTIFLLGFGIRFALCPLESEANPKDRFRTTINVLGDSLGAGLVDYISKTELKNMPISSLEMERYGVGESEKLHRKDKAGTSFDADVDWNTTAM